MSPRSMSGQPSLSLMRQRKLISVDPQVSMIFAPQLTARFTKSMAQPFPASIGTISVEQKKNPLSREWGEPLLKAIPAIGRKSLG